MNNIGLWCYKDQNEYDIQIITITNPSKNKYTLSLPKVKYPRHLGFEINESNNIIGFTYDYTYTDESGNKSEYIPKYKIIAYDRLLNMLKESEYKSFKIYSNRKNKLNKNVNNHKIKIKVILKKIKNYLFIFLY